MGDARGLVARYRALLEDRPLLAEGLCWTVLPGPVEEDAFFSALSQSPVRAFEPVALDEALEMSYDTELGDRCSAWLIAGDDWTGLFEFNGFAGSMPETLKALAAVSSPVVSMYWNDAIDTHQLSLAQRDRIQSTGELHEMSETDLAAIPDLADAVRAVLADDAEDERVVGLAVVELVSGARLDEPLLAERWPLIQFARRPERSQSDNVLDRKDPELFAALDAAGPAARLAARTELIEYVLRAKNLHTEPAAANVAEVLARGEHLSPAPAALYELNDQLQRRYTVLKHGFSDTAAWQRSRGVGMLFRFLNPRDGDTEYRRRYEGWFQALLALGEDQWPAARAAALNRLRPE